MYEPLKQQWVDFQGRLLIVGFGGIGQGVLPLILRHIGIAPEQITIVSAAAGGADVAAAYGVTFIEQPLTRENYRQVLESRLAPGDFLLNLSINVGSVDLIAWCQGHDVLYLDACIEPWAGGYVDCVRYPPPCAPTMPCARRPWPCGKPVAPARRQF